MTSKSFKKPRQAALRGLMACGVAMAILGACGGPLQPQTIGHRHVSSSAPGTAEEAFLPPARDAEAREILRLDFQGALLWQGWVSSESASQFRSRMSQRTDHGRQPASGLALDASAGSAASASAPTVGTSYAPPSFGAASASSAPTITISYSASIPTTSAASAPGANLSAMPVVWAGGQQCDLSAAVARIRSLLDSTLKSSSTIPARTAAAEDSLGSLDEVLKANPQAACAVVSFLDCVDRELAQALAEASSAKDKAKDDDKVPEGRGSAFSTIAESIQSCGARAGVVH